ncbi:glutathione S-transferase family protein [Amorphus coralli]|uniref:glutathione S-transferase family protein n=1 Tax=Amorphus coralli TaxID=340680 RepID=UPI0003643DDD|nr:glutathione S-transferase family protein [Amorphus coralli]
MITLYWCPQTRSQRIAWLLEETGLDYERCKVDVRVPETLPAEFRAASPMGKVPALRDGDTTVWDSAAICAYIADHYPETGLAPKPAHPDRARFLQWLIFTPSVIEPAVSERVWGWTPSPERNAWGDFDKMIAAFETGLGDRPWIMGNAFSAADIMLGSSAVFLRQFAILPDSAVLNAYADRCEARPAFRRALAFEEAG